MLLKILLLIFLNGHCISCTQNERFLHSRTKRKRIIFEEKKPTNNTKTFLSAQECFNEDSVICNSTNEDKHKHYILSKRSICQPNKEKEGKHKRFKLNGINLSGLVNQSYEFDESPPVKRGLYLYKEIFCPCDYSQIQGNYFNAPFFEKRYDDENERDHIREKRFSQNFYNGNSENQFTSDNIEEYINLKSGERTRQKISNLEKAFQKLEQDITELAKLKSMAAMNSKRRNKLSLNPKKDNIEVDLRMPSNIQHLNRDITEEVVRVYVPKASKSSIQGLTEMVPELLPISQEQLKPSFQTSSKNNMVDNGDKKVFSSIENPMVSFNIKLNKNSQNGEDK